MVNCPVGFPLLMILFRAVLVVCVFLSRCTMQERCCRPQALNVTLQREYMCCSFRVFYSKMSYFSVNGPGLLLSFACTDSYYTYKMTK